MENMKLEYLEEGQEAEVKEKWKIENDDSAEWWIDTKEEELVEVRRYKIAIQNKIKLLQEKLAKAEQEEKGIIDRRNIYLEEYFKTLDEKQIKKTATLEKYRLPSGEIRFKYPGPDYKKDDEVLSKWLKGNGMKEFIKTEIITKPKWSDLKKQTTVVGNQVVYVETGEIIEGVEAIEREPVFEVVIK